LREPQCTGYAKKVGCNNREIGKSRTFPAYEAKLIGSKCYTAVFIA